MSSTNTNGVCNGHGGNKGKDFARFLRPSDPFHRPTDVIKGGLCCASQVLQVNVVACRYRRGPSYHLHEFTFEEEVKGEIKTIRAICFGDDGFKNAKILKPGLSCKIRHAGTGLIKVRKLHKFSTQRYNFELEYHLPEMTILESVVEFNSGSAQIGINELNAMISGPGEINCRVDFSDVIIVDAQLQRYEACDECHTRIYRNDENERYCQSCYKDGGEKSKKFKLHMFFRNMEIKDRAQNRLKGVSMFNKDCESLLKKTAADWLFDNGTIKRALEQSLVQANVDVSIHVKCRDKHREAGTRTGISIVASWPRFLSSPPAAPDPVITTNRAVKVEPDNGTSPDGNVQNQVQIDPALAPGPSKRLRLTASSSGDDQGVGEMDDSNSMEAVGEESYSEVDDDVDYGFDDIDNVARCGYLPLFKSKTAEKPQPKGTYPLGKVAALIINNFKFEMPTTLALPSTAIQEDATPLENGNEVDDTRYGSEHDVGKIMKLFKEKIDVTIFQTPFIDVTSKTLPKILKDFKHFAVQMGAHSCLVVLMSHGAQNIISMSDRVEVNLYLDIVLEFSDANFPQFVDKPKLFVCHCCQDFADTLACVSEKNERHLQGQGWLTKLSALFICFPQISGNNAIRLKKEGTLFIHCLCKVIRERAHDTDLVEIINLVERELDELINGNSELACVVAQVPQTQTIKFNGHYFYFAPRTNNGD